MCLGCPWDSGTVGLEPSRVGCSGQVWDVPGLPATLGCDSGIVAIWSGMLGTCLECPWVSRDSGMGWTVGLELCGVEHSGHVQDVPGLPATLNSGFGALHSSGTLWTCPGCP